jgi:S1-C subfamily serine protease
MMKKSVSMCPVLTLLILSVLVSTCNTSVQPPNPVHSPTISADIQLLESIQTAFVTIYNQSKPAVVSVSARNVKRKVTHGSEGVRYFHELEGTGIIFRSDGYIVTNDHVVNGAEMIRVRPFNRQWYDAELIGEDASTDIAVLKIDAGEELPTLSFADSDKVRVGQFAIAIGNPFSLDYTITTGIVSGIGRSLPLGDDIIRYQDFIQTDAWLSKGNSGGPLLNIYGEVIGLNSVIRKSDDAIVTGAVKAGASFAIPINLVKKISAQRGGLQRGDIITQYQGKKVSDLRQVQFLIAESLVGEKAKIAVLRHGQQKTLEVAIGEIPPRLVERWVDPTSESWKRLGFVTRELGTHDFENYTFLKPGDRGVMVKAIKSGAPAEKAGILRGALIVAINGQEIGSEEQFGELLKTALNKPEISFEITHSEGKEVISVKPIQE